MDDEDAESEQVEDLVRPDGHRPIMYEFGQIEEANSERDDNQREDIVQIGAVAENLSEGGQI